MHKFKQGFTLVELIVVITILAILGTISFISLQGYSRDARDSVRTSDLSRIKTSLELFQLDTGKYPEVTNGQIITYSGVTARTQGYFGESTFINVEKLDKIPTDPLTQMEYIYSTTATKQEFEVAGVIESDSLSYISDQVNAGDETAILKITGNYNGKILKVSTGGLDYVLAVPSIINGSGFTLDEIIKNKFLAYNGYKNLPSQYDGGIYNVLGDPDITFVNYSDYEVFIGDINDLSDSTQTGTTSREVLMSKLQSAYTGTVLSNIGEIEEILNLDSGDIESLASAIIINNLGGSTITKTTTTVETKYDITTNANCLVTDINPTKKIIIDDISNYLGCEITDYEGVSIPGSGVYIAGLTNNDEDIMVVAKSDLSGTKKWGCHGTATSANSDTDGMANTMQFLSVCSETGVAIKGCSDIGTNWYLPAHEELTTIYTNKSKLGTFAVSIGSYYWNSSEHTSTMAGFHAFWTLGRSDNGKTEDYHVRCASSF